MLIKVKSAVSWMRARLSAISLADIQKHLAKIIILAPMAVLLIYLAIFSQPRYMSESKVAIKRSDDLNSGSLNFGLLLGASNPSSAEDALYLKEYINSPDMLAALDGAGLTPYLLQYIHKQKASPATFVLIEARKGAHAKPSVAEPIALYGPERFFTLESLAFCPFLR